MSMESVMVDVCVRPYRHDIVDTVRRKPKYLKSRDVHVVKYKGVNYDLKRDSSGYAIWIDEE